MPNAIVHFEIQADDVERAKTFYEGVFGWEIEQWGQEQYWIIKTGRGTYPSGEKVGIDGGLEPRRTQLRASDTGVNAFVATISTDNIDETLQKIQDAGGTIVTPKAELPVIGWVAYCKDTEGNNFGIIQPAMS